MSPASQTSVEAAVAPDAVLDALEAEAIHIFRETAGAFRRPVMLYSIGKDSSVLLHLAVKAFAPGKVPFPILHIDTTWKFREMIEFRNRVAAELGVELRVHTNPEGVAEGVTPFTHGTHEFTRIMKTVALRQALDEGGYDAAFGGAAGVDGGLHRGHHQADAHLLHAAIAVFEHLGEVVPGVHVHHGERRLGRPERLLGQAQQHGRVLAGGEQQHGLARLGRHLAHDVDRLRLERADMRDRAGVGLEVGVGEGHATCSPHSVFSLPAQRPSRPEPGRVQGAQPIEA